MAYDNDRNLYNNPNLVSDYPSDLLYVIPILKISIPGKSHGEYDSWSLIVFSRNRYYLLWLSIVSDR